MEEAVIQKGEGYWSVAWRRLRRQKLPMFCLTIIAIYIAVAVWSLIGLGVPDWEKAEDLKAYQPPSAQHWFGTDFLGRDVVAKTINGTKVAIIIAMFGAMLMVLIGLLTGVIAGYFGGVVDEVITWIYSTLYSIPYILLLMAFAFVLKDRTVSLFDYEIQLRGMVTVCLALGLTSWVTLCRLIRGEVIKHRDRDYIIAARAIGASHWRIICKYLIPNVFHLVIIIFSLNVVSFIHAEVILSFLGLGITDQPSWGRMIDDAKLEFSRGVWWQLTAASVAIFVISFALHIFGDALRDALDPKLKEGGI